MHTAPSRPCKVPQQGQIATGNPTLHSLLNAKERIARTLSEDSEAHVVQALIDQIPDFVFVKDLECRFVLANAALVGAYGASSGSLEGLTDFDLHPAERAELFFSYEQQIIRTGEALFNMEESFPNSDGVQKWYSTTKVPLRNRDGTICGLIGVARDVTQSRLMQAFELRQADILAMIATSAELGTVLSELVLLIESQLTDIQASVLLFDAETGRLHHGAAPSLPREYRQAIEGVAIGPRVGSCGTAAYRGEAVIVSDTHSDPLWADFRELAARWNLRSCWSTPILGHDRRVLGTFALYSSKVRSPGPDELRLIETATRIAGIAIQRQQSEVQLTRMAHYDALTELPNRVLFMDRLVGALKQRRAQSRPVALLYIDLDGFKQVNDLLGHFFGDRLLAEVGRRLRTFASERITLARLGGDEFAAIQSLAAPGDRAESARLAAEVIDALSLPFDIEGHHIVTGATVGIAIAPEDDDDPASLLRDADLALYQAKTEERGGVRFFEPVMNVRAQQRHQLEIDLRQALEADSFELHFQPLVQLESAAILGFEALLRWHHPRRGLVSPGEFIPVAEELGLIVDIGDWVLREACMQAARWPAHIKVAINLSPIQFRDGHLFDSVGSALASSGLASERLELEITESVLLLDNEANLALLHRLRDLGVQISLDDFGIGYSSLSYLRSFPFTKIKIDRSFVRDLGQNWECLAIVRAVLRLAADPGMKTIAEGIETIHQMEWLRREGCQEGQGFLFSPAVPVSRADLLIENRSALCAA